MELAGCYSESLSAVPVVGKNPTESDQRNQTGKTAERQGIRFGVIVGDFFHGWRRKIGIVTLVIACVFMVGWVRSHSVQDVLSIHSGRHTSESVSSVKCVLVWQQCQIDDAEYMTALPEWTTYPFHSETKWYDETGMVWRWQLCGFGFGELPSDLVEGVQARYFFIPYWSVTVPLTLVSVWLLLSRPRKSNLNHFEEVQRGFASDQTSDHRSA